VCFVPATWPLLLLHTLLLLRLRSVGRLLLLLWLLLQRVSGVRPTSTH
jgi:hypothetical protein